MANKAMKLTRLSVSLTSFVYTNARNLLQRYVFTNFSTNGVLNEY